MRTIFNLYRYYRRQGAGTCSAARRAVHVYRNGF
jgi:hypothetical protein